jgi:ATP-dependent exoDNAse (exonuclease V) alpha subunit
MVTYVKRQQTLAKIEINELKSACDAIGLRHKQTTSRIETKRLAPETRFHLKFPENRYTFDHERGEVFKLKHGLLNWIGGHLLDTAEKIQTDRTHQASPETLSQHIKLKAVCRIANFSNALGNALTTYEKVENVEAIAARNALYQAKETEKANLAGRLHAKEAELDNLIKTGNKEGKKTLIVMDESSMTGAYDAEKISHLAKEINARVIFQGDIKQHGSIPAGRAFEQAQRAGMNVSILEETRRFNKATKQTKRAITEMRLGNYAAAIEALDKTIVSEREFAKVTAERYLENMQSLKQAGNLNPKVGVVVTTNKDRKAISASIHNLLQDKQIIDTKNYTKEHLDDPKMTEAEYRHVSEHLANGVDRLIARRNYKNLGVSKGELVTVRDFDVAHNRIHGITESGKKITINPDKQTKFTPAKLESREYSVGDKVEARENLYPNGNREQRVPNGARGEILAIDKESATIQWHDGQKTVIGNKEMQFVDLAYAHTTFKEQGATNDREIIAVSEVGAKVFNKQAAYVAATRAKHNTEIVTSDLKTLLKNAGKDVSKTTAIDIENQHSNTSDISKEKTFDQMMQSILSKTSFKEQEISQLSNSKSIQHTGSVATKNTKQKDINIEQLLQR